MRQSQRSTVSQPPARGVDVQNVHVATAMSSQVVMAPDLQCGSRGLEPRLLQNLRTMEILAAIARVVTGRLGMSDRVWETRIEDRGLEGHGMACETTGPELNSDQERRGTIPTGPENEQLPNLYRTRVVQVQARHVAGTCFGPRHRRYFRGSSDRSSYSLSGE